MKGVRQYTYAYLLASLGYSPEAFGVQAPTITGRAPRRRVRHEYGEHRAGSPAGPGRPADPPEDGVSPRRLAGRMLAAANLVNMTIDAMAETMKAASRALYFLEGPGAEAPNARAMAAEALRQGLGLGEGEDPEWLPHWFWLPVRIPNDDIIEAASIYAQNARAIGADRVALPDVAYRWLYEAICSVRDGVPAEETSPEELEYDGVTFIPASAADAE